MDKTWVITATTAKAKFPIGLEKGQQREQAKTPVANNESPKWRQG
jgi:hypothetical protein